MSSVVCCVVVLLCLALVWASEDIGKEAEDRSEKASEVLTLNTTNLILILLKVTQP